ncbi:MAG: anaerobic ribonucleoside-triphosphate reductase activating protein [Faecousia sp.]
MNVGEIILADCANGSGIRVSVFVSGCTNRCPGCFQPETWDFDYGKPYDEAMEQRIIDELKKPYYRGLTLLGGEPFEPSNQRELVKLIRRVRKELPAKDIWMYTGFTYEDELAPGGTKHTEVTDEILNSIDVLVDGRFVLEKKNLALRFRGSENQRIIEMKKTRAAGKVMLHPLHH